MDDHSIRGRYKIFDRAGNYLKQKLLLAADDIASVGQKDLEELESYLNKDLGISSSGIKKLQDKTEKNRLDNRLRKAKSDLIDSFKSHFEALLFLISNYQKNNSYDGTLAQIFPKNRTDKKGHKKWEYETVDEFTDAMFQDSEGFRRKIFSEANVYLMLHCIFDVDNDLDINDKGYRIRITDIIVRKGLDEILNYSDPKYHPFVKECVDKIKNLSMSLASEHPN